MGELLVVAKGWFLRLAALEPARSNRQFWSLVCWPMRRYS